MAKKPKAAGDRVGADTPVDPLTQYLLEDLAGRASSALAEALEKAESSFDQTPRQAAVDALQAVATFLDMTS
ncbi:MAG TPA: hypothetical protein VHN38_05635, partial [Immundisolibacter sp.]|nr:hypothetical protein [Immundisolibacter sp.]